MKKVSIADIENYKIKFLENSNELLEEANILLKNKRYARAYSLAHLACEELAKIIMITKIAYNISKGENTYWEKFNKRLKNHKEKIKYIFAIDFIFNLTINNKVEVQRYFDDLKFVKHYNDLKNYSIYVSNIGNAFNKPSEIFDNEFVKGYVKLANNRFNFIKKIETLYYGKLAKILKSEDFKHFREIIDKKHNIFSKND